MSKHLYRKFRRYNDFINFSLTFALMLLIIAVLCVNGAWSSKYDDYGNITATVTIGKTKHEASTPTVKRVASNDVIGQLIKTTQHAIPKPPHPPKINHNGVPAGKVSIAMSAFN